MTELVWDKIDERHYESGLDRGVLYLPDGIGVVWNGLTSIDEDPGSGTTVPLYFDGIKYHDLSQATDYNASLGAYTYPDEFSDLEGMAELVEGLRGDDGFPQRFGLAYRTQHDTGYKLHILYNLIATPDTKNYVTVGSSLTPMELKWGLTSVPEEVDGFAPSEHFIFDSATIDPSLLFFFEDMLYGSLTTQAYLPPIEELVKTALLWEPVIIVPNLGNSVDGGNAESAGEGLFDGGDSFSSGTGTLDGGDSAAADESGIASLLPGIGDMVPTDIPGIYMTMPNSRLVETEDPGFYELE